MVQIEFLGPIAREPLFVEANNLRDVASHLQKIDDLAIWLEKVAIAVNDTLIKDINYPLKDGDRVTLLPPVCGG